VRPPPIRLSILVVAYNGGSLLHQCLESVHRFPPRSPFEVIVVDNGSTDGSCDGIGERWPAVKCVATGANLGLARAFNLALRECRGSLILSLDSDTRLFPGTLDRLVARLDETAGVGVVGGWLLNPDLTPQRTARRAPSAWNAVFGRRSVLTRLFPGNPLSRRYLMDDYRNETNPFEVDWVSTAALLVRREVIDAVGGLDEGFFVYWVDADWCARIRRRGWRIEAVPQARVLHDENLQSGRRMRRRTRLILDFHRGAYRYYRKHHIRNTFGPLHLMAVVGLSARAALLVGWDYVLTSANRARRVAVSRMDGAA
jgi:hypothetical protein